MGSSPEQFGKLIDSETKRWTEMIQRLKLKAE